MRVAYVHLPRFPIQRRLGETPSLRGRAFALVGEVAGHQRVTFLSQAAGRHGVRAGMSATEAAALCPSLLTVRYEAEEEVGALCSLGEALMALGPGFQLAAPDGLWLDASAAALCRPKGWEATAEDPLGERPFLERVLECCAAHGYQGRAVVAGELFTARAVARYGAWDRQGTRTAVIAGGQGGRALAALPLAALEGTWEPLAVSLRSLGLSTLGEAAALPPGAVVARLGASGLHAHRLIRGEDDRRLVAATLAEVLEEGVSLDWPAESVEPLLFALKTSLDRVCARLSGRQQAAVRLTLKLKLDPSGTRELGLVLARPTAMAKLLLDLCKHRISDLTLENPVAGLSVRVDEACEDRGQQLGLGDEPQGDAALEVVLARLATALGEEALFSAEAQPWHRPETAYSPKPFRPQTRAGGLLGELPEERRAVNVSAPKEEASLTPWDPGAPWPKERVVVEKPASRKKKGRAEEVRAQLAVEPATLRERPARLFSQAAVLDAFVDERGVIAAARLLGKRRRVLSLSGPERLCGEWWGTDPYSRDYFRVQFDGLGPAWIYRDAKDGRFYLQGMFD